jgi:hypothetical protein
MQNLNNDIALDIFNDETQQLLSHPTDEDTHPTFPLETAATQDLEEESAEDVEDEAPFSMKVQLLSSSTLAGNIDQHNHLYTDSSRDLAIDFLLKSSRTLDVFCVQLYKYYTQKGLLPILLSEFMYLLYVFSIGSLISFKDTRVHCLVLVISDLVCGSLAHKGKEES